MIDLWLKLKALDLAVALGVWLIGMIAVALAAIGVWWRRRTVRRWNEAADRQPPTRRW